MGVIDRDETIKSLATVRERYIDCRMSEHDNGFVDGIDFCIRYIKLVPDAELGSASSLIACEEMGYDYVGFELDPEYYAKSKARLDTFNAQMRITDFLQEDTHDERL